MAVKTHTRDASERHLVYGLNVTVSIVLAIAILVAALLLGGEYRTQFDWTRSGRNSLSPRTLKLLGGLDQNITITAIYPIRTESAELDQRRQDAVRDLLELYEGAGGGHVKAELFDPLKKPGKVTALEERLSQKPAYRDEATAHREALEQFARFAEQVRATVGNTVQQLQSLSEQNPALAQSRECQIIGMNLQHVLGELDKTSGAVAEYSAEAIPRYGRAVGIVKSFLTLAQASVDEARRWLLGEIGQLPQVDRATLAEFAETSKQCQTLLDEQATLQKLLDDLPKLKLEEMYEALRRRTDLPPVLVETESEAHVVTFDDVWAYRMDQNAPAGTGPDPSRDFVGEAAVSSAILRLTQKEKTGVIFVRWGGSPLLTPDFSNFNPNMRRMPTAPYQALNAYLQRANFETAEWNVKETKEPPALEDVARTIYVVFAPVPPQQPNPMQPPTEPGISEADKQLVLDAIGQSGMAVFMSRWQAPLSPYMPMARTYEYADYLKDKWGIDVKYSYVAMPFAPSPDKPDLWVPAMRDQSSVLLLTSPILRVTDHPIGAPLKSEPIAFWMTTPIEIVTGEGKPEGVNVDVVAEVRETERVWAFENIQALEADFREKNGTAPKDSDILAPFPVAVAATNGAGGKLVVFASEQFPADNLTQASQLALAGGGLVAYLLYPGNTDLFVNSLHWLTGDADRIAVGPRKGALPRLDKLADGFATQFCQVFIVGIWPGIALLAGGAAWLIRRR